MTDDLLSSFRSEIPPPDEATAQRIYERATTGRRHLVTRRRLVAGIAVLALAGVAGGLSATLGGGGSKHPAAGGQNGPAMFSPLQPLALQYNRDGLTLTSIDVRVNDTHYSNATLVLEVLHTDALQPSDATDANTRSVFEETAAMTSSGSTGQDVSVSSWSGTLSPSDWDGGCQDGLYRVRTAVYATGTSVADPFASGETDRSASPWVPCSGAGANGPSGFNGPTGGIGPTGG